MADKLLLCCLIEGLSVWWVTPTSESNYGYTNSLPTCFTVFLLWTDLCDLKVQFLSLGVYYSITADSMQAYFNVSCSLVQCCLDLQPFYLCCGELLGWRWGVYLIVMFPIIIQNF